MGLMALDRVWTPTRDRGAPPSSPRAQVVPALLAEGVTAILLPHLQAALRAYSTDHHDAVAAAYGAGALMLADLMSQEASIPSWRKAAAEAFRKLIERSESEDFPVDDVSIARAFADGERLKEELELSFAYHDICAKLDDALKALADKRTVSQGGIAVRAAMARLEAVAFVSAAAPSRVQGWA